jgi:hypothetical protein
VAQILSYAAGPHGMTVDEFEGTVLAKCLAGHSLVDRIRDAAQAEAVDADELRQNVHDTLQSGGFRLVLVLDQAPPDLVRLVGYLEYFGKRGEVVLPPRLLPESAGLTSLYCWPDGRPAIQLRRSVFQRRAPRSIAAAAEAAGTDIGQGNMVQTTTDDLFDALFRAYQEVAETAGRAG